MTQKQQTLVAFILLVLVAALYRVVPGRPFGFDPMIAIAIFGGAVIANKKWAFALPLAAMLLSDVLYEGLTRAGVVNMPGLYDGQWLNYLLLAGITFFGIFMKRINLRHVAGAAIAAPLLYFFLSNTGTWAFHGGWARPITFTGWLQALADGLPFLKWSLAGSLLFSGLFFGSWALIMRPHADETTAAA
jgi:hypothetical protein